jgi:hypothetical protein
MVSKFPPYERPYLFLNGISRKIGRIWCSGFSFPGQPVFRIKAEFAALRLFVAHENPGIASNIAIKGVHAPGWGLLGARFELPRGGEPAFVRQELQPPFMGQFLEIYSELPLGRDHSPQGAEFCNKGLEGLTIRTAGHHVLHSDAPFGLFQGEMAEIGENQGQFLFMVRATSRLPRILHQDNAETPWVFPG